MKPLNVDSIFNLNLNCIFNVETSTTMTTRDRTKAFMTYRESSLPRRPRKKVGETLANGGGDGDQASLLGGDHLENGGGAAGVAGSTVERPSWMHFIDEANVDIDTIKSKRKKKKKSSNRKNFFFFFFFF
jgi:hypothetical protein